MQEWKDKEGRSLFERLAENASARKWIILAGIGGIALIFLSSLFQGQPAESGQAAPAVAESSAAEYAQSLQQQLESLIAQIDGAGQAQVLVTLERSAQQVYATEETKSARTGESSQEDERQSSYLVVRAADGSEQALKVTEVQPTVKGVVIVCPGGGDPAVAERITQAVTTALDISSARVCVVKAK
ncbi:MAG TPA: stage III sporulation protein AG [Candidatus Caccousia avistercoris]|nr:stage III sporulation protein AG [Candidatus Caccousia avistercoris]